MKVFDLAVKSRSLPAKLDELVPLSFMGAAAVKFYKAKVEAMKQLGIAEDQREATLSDGQDAGEMLLRIEARIGELLPSPEEAKSIGAKHRHGQDAHVPVRPDGVNRHRGESARAIHSHPEAVERVIKEARENEDIPTRTAVLNTIKADKAEEKLRSFRAQHAKEPSPVLAEYLEKAIDHLVQVNSVVKRFFDYPDQVDASRMKELVRQVSILVEIISKKTGREAWKQLA